MDRWMDGLDGTVFDTSEKLMNEWGSVAGSACLRALIWRVACPAVLDLLACILHTHP